MKVTGRPQNVTPVKLTTMVLTAALSVKPAQLGTVAIQERRCVWDTSPERTVLFVRAAGLGVGVIFTVILTVRCGLVMTRETRSAQGKGKVCHYGSDARWEGKKKYDHSQNSGKHRYSDF